MEFDDGRNFPPGKRCVQRENRKIFHCGKKWEFLYMSIDAVCVVDDAVSFFRFFGELFLKIAGRKLPRLSYRSDSSPLRRCIRTCFRRSEKPVELVRFRVGEAKPGVLAKILVFPSRSICIRHQRDAAVAGCSFKRGETSFFEMFAKLVDGVFQDGLSVPGGRQKLVDSENEPCEGEVRLLRGSPHRVASAGLFESGGRIRQKIPVPLFEKNRAR